MGMSKVSQIPQQNSAIKNKPFILKRVSLPNNKDKSNSPLAMRKSSHFDKVEIKNTETVPIKEVVPEKVNEKLSSKLSIVEMRRRFFESTFDHSPITIPNVDRISPNLTKSENLTKTVNILEKQINPTVNQLKEKESIEKQVFTPLSKSRIPLRTPNRTLTYERKPFYTLLMTSPPSKLPLSFNSRIIAKNFNQIQNNTFLVHNHIHSHTLKSVTPTVLKTSHPQNSITNSELDENNEIAPLVDEIKLEVPPSEERVIDSQQSTSYCPSETSSNSSNYLIDDEISDQPQLTFTFKHFNKSDFSRSMISLGSECCSSIESIQSLIFDNNSDNNIQSNNDNSFLIARNSLNEKSKSQKSPQNEPSPEKLCEMLTSEISELRLTLEKLKNVLEEQEKREKAKDLLLQQLIKAFTHQQLS